MWGPDQPEPAQPRHTADTITDDALTALYEQLDAAQQTELARQLTICDKAFASATLRAARAITRAERAEAALDAARQARRRLSSALIAVSPRLDEPYPDNPVLTPWTRFVAPALRDLRTALDAHTTPTETTPPVHVGNRANAEDCPGCSGTNPPYPFLCPAQPGDPAGPYPEETT
ncbi:hypothetical protein [Streptomyces sp. CS081A]|uniref:hypothetical protein n=1 Tax=Streptomyces sp. CS081A TaxID=2162709 RepID=UPI000D50DF36|nr:hypothetical protein [Streptomyces sp. CS081A]PVC73501.1 hypothetical protein DBP18_14235 [Streptomyces sp. CS081A]